MIYCGTGEKTFAKLGGAVCSCCAVWLCIASGCWAQGAQLPAAPPSRSHVPSAASAAAVPSTHSSAASKRALPARRKKNASPTDATAKLATVNLTNGNLTIQANNSDLGQILRDMAKMSGMTIDGLNKSPRVSGIYGPGKSREVLTDLLAGTGYNFIMVGDIANGAPRQLLLIPGSGPDPASTSSHPGPPVPDEGKQSDPPDLETNPAVPDPTAPDPVAPDAAAPDLSAPDATAPDPSVTAPGAPESEGPGSITPAPTRDSESDNNKRAEQNQKSLEQEQPQQEAPQQTAPQ